VTETETVTESETVTGFTWSRLSSRTPDTGLRTPDPGLRSGSDTDTVTATVTDTDTGWIEPVTGIPAVPFSGDCRPRYNATSSGMMNQVAPIETSAGRNRLSPPDL